jgi:hypothetical protein
MLVESYNTSGKGAQAAKVKGIKEYMKIMEDSGLSKQQALARLTDDEKALIEEDKFIQAAKLKYGR